MQETEIRQTEKNLTRDPKEFMITQLALKRVTGLNSNFVVDSEEKAIYLLNDFLADSPNEFLMGISLNKDKEPVCACVLGMGNEGHVDGNYKNIFSFIFASGGDSFILVHNHPGAKTLKPSNVDLQTWNELSVIASKLGIKFRDFIITGNIDQKRAYYSWNEKGVITQYDFLRRSKNIEFSKPLEVNRDENANEINPLLEKSKFNEMDSDELLDTKKKSKGLFGFLK